MDQILDYLNRRRTEQLEELSAYLRIPSVSSEAVHGGDVAFCAEHTALLLRDAGAAEVTVHPTPRHPIVTGRFGRVPGRPTVLVYGHYDVQPVDPVGLWERDPFEPHVRDGRLVARGAADDKGQIFMHLKAAQALGEVLGEVPVNLLFLIEGEEEIGSPNLPPFLAAHRELFGDVSLAIISDSPMWAEGQPAITAGLRGLVLFEATVTTANRDLHSGSYGGGVANPLEVMARMVAGMKDGAGRVTIPGFYDGVVPLGEEERRLLAAIPFDPAVWLAEVGSTQAGGGEEGCGILERLWFRPTFEVNGMWGGYTGPGAKTVLPARAQGKFSMRLVPGQDPERVVELAMAHFVSLAPAGAQVEVKRVPGGGRAVAVPMDLPAMGAVRRALREGFGREPVVIREGGSIPVVADFATVLGVPTLLIGFCLPDARAHSPNENLHLETFYTGMGSLARLYSYLGAGQAPAHGVIHTS